MCVLPSPRQTYCMYLHSIFDTSQSPGIVEYARRFLGHWTLNRTAPLILIVGWLDSWIVKDGGDRQYSTRYYLAWVNPDNTKREEKMMIFAATGETAEVGFSRGFSVPGAELAYLLAPPFFAHVQNRLKV